MLARGASSGYTDEAMAFRKTPCKGEHTPRVVTYSLCGGRATVRLGCRHCPVTWDDDELPEEVNALLRASFDAPREPTVDQEFFEEFCPEFNRVGSPAWKFEGYNLMQNARKWAEGKEGVTVVKIDDDRFMSGDLLLLESYDGEAEWFGVCVVVLTQYSTEPTVFWLRTPQADLIDTLRGYQKHSMLAQKASDLKDLSAKVRLMDIYKPPQPKGSITCPYR